MSDTLLELVPVVPTFQPGPEAAARAERLLRALLPHAESVRAEFKPSVVFVDPGGNWSGVACPLCGADVESWWGESMQAARQSNFEQLDIVTRCCAKEISLNDLRYAAPAAIGRFVLEAVNPNCARLADAELTPIAECLGIEVRQVWVRV
jgi:hypothetical protein